ncbi:unnamed protein product [Sphenostylis stenocarpa]|uniref:Uncharacterized protein n=1 Tax=Sphenostylis stenocarpa TaxID=92480 RepID=A0AA86T7Q3_9FABA|nr:unnamed protein product [Sphenostylis stenocarpa]
MQIKFHSLVKDKANASGDGSDNGVTRFMRGSQLARKTVWSAFSCVLGIKSPPGKHASKVKKNEPFDDSGNRKAWNTNGKASSWEEPVEAALSQLLSLEETDRSGLGREKSNNRQDVKMKLPLLSFLDKKKGWNNDGVTRFGQVRRKLSLRYLFRIPSKILVFRLKLKLTRSQFKKKATKQFEQEADEDENEDRDLCKKRILMGGRCRPLSSPGYKEIYSSGTRAQRYP